MCTVIINAQNKTSQWSPGPSPRSSKMSCKCDLLTAPLVTTISASDRCDRKLCCEIAESRRSKVTFSCQASDGQTQMLETVPKKCIKIVWGVGGRPSPARESVTPAQLWGGGGVKKKHLKNGYRKLNCGLCDHLWKRSGSSNFRRNPSKNKS